LNASTANKGDGLFHLCEELGLDRRQVMAMGDSNNDLDMLKFAGLAVAMGNAEERVKRISDFVTTTNDDLGVVKALKQFVLDEQVS
ncbi:MAG: HAD hydrolase family protein, partial [Eubacteriaceae bacterium]|nr:HAD hydrolase family protein [Eubacteriaceae bacterium]